MRYLLATIGLSAATLVMASPGIDRPPELIEGSWTYSSPRTILGRGTDTTITLKEDDGVWTIAYQVVHFPSIRAEDQTAKVTSEGPYEVTAQQGILAIQKPDRKVHYTYKLDTHSLVMPAIVQQEPGRWIYRSGRESMLIRCEHDPFKVPVGRAWFPGAVGGHGFYTYEEAPRSRARSNTRYLRLLEQTKKGYLAERSRLIYDEYGSPRYERMLGTGERSRHEYQILVYLNRSKELVK